MNNLQILKDGFNDGLKVTWKLSKILIPVYFIITFLQQMTPIIDWLAVAFEPITGLLGLPGEAALPLVLANCLSVYASIPAILAFPFTPEQITILGSMILVSHSLPVEISVAKQAGSNPWLIVAVRFVFAFILGFILSLILL